MKQIILFETLRNYSGKHLTNGFLANLRAPPVICEANMQSEFILTRILGPT